MYIFYITSVALCIYFAKRLDKFGSHSYNPVILFICINFLYTNAGVVATIGDVELQTEIFDFLARQTVGVFGFTFAAILTMPILNSVRLQDDRSYGRKNSIGCNANVRKPLLLNFSLVFFIALFLIFINFRFGGLMEIYKKGYASLLGGHESHGFGASISDILFFYLFPTAFLTIGYFRGFQAFWIFASLLFLVVLIMIGARNLVLFYIGSALVLHSLRSKKRMHYTSGVIIFALGLPFFMILAYVRNIGFHVFFLDPTVLSRINIAALFVGGGEFFTSMNVFLIDSESPGWWTYAPGISYFNAFLALIPRFLWPSRPDAISTLFSDNFAPSGEGVGFSINLEAYINFGFFGIFIVNFIISSFWLCLYYIANYRRTFEWAFLYSCVVFVAFNINRIDFQTVFKMAWIFFLVAFFVASFVRLLQKLK